MGKRPKKVLVELRNVGRSTDDGQEGGGDTLLLKMAGMSIIVKLVVVKNQPSG